MAALRKLYGMLGPLSPLHTRTLPFYGHGSRVPAGQRPGLGVPMPSPGVVGTRDDIVLGMLDFIDASQAGWPGSVEMHFGIATLTGVELQTQSLQMRGSTPPFAAGRFDLVCACDGKNSRVRRSAAEQDTSLVVTEVHGRAGENTYKAFNLDLCQDAGDDLAEGWLCTQHSSVSLFRSRPV